MQFNPVVALAFFLVFGILGIGSYWYLSSFDIIPQELLDQFYLYAGVITIPVLIYGSFTATDKEFEDMIKKEKQSKIENDAIRAKYDSMPDLVKHSNKKVLQS